MRAPIAALALLLGPAAAQAHPHAWVEIETVVQADASGAIAGLRVAWTFDPLYSAYAISGFGTSQDGLDALATETIANLVDYAYFAEVWNDDAPVAFAPVTDYATTFIDGQWRLEFVLPFAAPHDPGDLPIRYAIYDPTYFVEIRHAAGDGAVAFDAGLNCRYALTPPNPSPEMTALAAALDRGRRAEGPIGRAFAEQATIRCD